MSNTIHSIANETADRIALALTVHAFENDADAARIIAGQTTSIRGTIRRAIENAISALSAKEHVKEMPRKPIEVTGPSLDKLSEPLRLFLDDIGRYNFGQELTGVHVASATELTAGYGWDEENVTPYASVKMTLSATNPNLEIPYTREKNRTSILDDTHNAALLAFYASDPRTSDADTLKRLWRGNPPKREPWIGDPTRSIQIPPNVYWQGSSANFYSYPDRRGMGVEFLEEWYPHRDIFPDFSELLSNDVTKAYGEPGEAATNDFHEAHGASVSTE